MVDYNQMALMQQQQAQNAALAALMQGQGQATGALKEGYTTGRGDVKQAVPQQTGALQTGYDRATGAIQGGLTGSLSALGQGYDTARGELGAGYGAARGDIAGGVAAYDPYYQTGTAAQNLYAGALGVGGPGGAAAARDAFQASPGYQWAVDQATQNAMRRQGAMGMLGSGNTLDAVTRLGSNLANQEYQNYLSRLQGLGAHGMDAAGARYRGAADMANLSAAQGTGQAALASDLGRSRANAYDVYGTRGADLATGLGTNLANVYGGTAKTLADLASGYGTNQANVYQSTAANTANTLMQGSQLASNIMGQQQQAQQAAQQRPWLLASGLLGGLGSLGSAVLSNPSNRIY